MELALTQITDSSFLQLLMTSEVRTISRLTRSISSELLTKCDKALLVRPPQKGDDFANWEASAAGFKEDAEGWMFVPPAKNVFTVFPGMFQSIIRTTMTIDSMPSKQVT